MIPTFFRTVPPLSLYVTITRNPSPLWRSGQQIPLDDWQAIIAKDPEFRQPTSAELTQSRGQATPEDAIWQAHPHHPAIWFTFDRGQIDVNLPDDLTLRKMAQVAALLRANVISEQGELFDPQGISLGLHDLPDDPADPKPPRLRQLAKSITITLILALAVCMVSMLAYLIFRLLQQNPW